MKELRFMVSFICTSIMAVGVGALLLEHGRSVTYVLIAITLLAVGGMLPAVYSLEGDPHGKAE